MLTGELKNEPRDVDAQEHSSTSSRTHAQASRRSAHYALSDWPLIVIDLYTEEGVIGRSYLEPYIRRLMRYLVPALHDFGEMLKGRRLAPIEFYEAARKSLHFV